MTTPLRVLVAGGGVAAVEALLALRTLGRGHVSIELLAPGETFVERPSSVLSPFSGEPAPSVSLDGLGALGVTVHHGSLASVDPERREVRTTGDGRLTYDRLIVATGAHLTDGAPGATTFRGPVNAGVVERALKQARTRAVFTLPGESGWTLPVYELALLAAHELPRRADLLVVTHEPRPLDIFGPVASDALSRLLDRAGVDFMGETVVTEVLGDALATVDGEMLTADAVISLPRVRGPHIEGLPVHAHGFIKVDEHARVVGAPCVYAAGDVTAGPIKHGGLATQQADAAAEAIAAEAGAPVTPRPCRRVLRGVVLTGEAPLFLRRDLDDDSAFTRPLRGAPPGVSRSQLWWPSGKIAGRYLTGFLAAGGHAGETLSDRPRRRPLRR
jgi:sulfide:quinone oxidoreductase